MNIYILDLFNENISDANIVDSWEDLKDYKKYCFNDDMIYLINDYLSNYKHHKEKEIKAMLEDKEVDFTSLNILSGARFGNDYIEYITGLEKIIDNMVNYFRL